MLIPKEPEEVESMEEHILIVDDEESIADLLEVYLRNENYIVHKFYNAADALNCVESCEPDLAILDVMLPDMSGFDLCQKIRRRHRYPVIMLTAKDEETDKIMSAQKARGADFETGNLMQRAKALIPILVPLFISSFRRADELAVAMECRCYHGGDGRTRMKQLHYGKIDVVAFVGGAVILVAVIVLARFGL